MQKNRSYCLPTQETIRQINAEVHLSPSGKVISAKSRQKYVMDILADDGYLEVWHIDSAGVFMALRNAWLSPVGCSTSKLSDEISSWIEGRNLSPGEIYDAIAKQLQKRQIRIIEWSATTMAHPPYEFRNAIYGDICRSAFVAMEKALDDVYKLLESSK